jgi:integrase
LSHGVPVKVVSQRLGHASITTTLDRSSRVSEEQDRETAGSLAAMIGCSG